MTKHAAKVLVTGAGGFIGSHLADACHECGFVVRAFLRAGSPNDIGTLRWSSNFGRFEIHRGDVRDFSSVERAVAGCDYVLHLAALTSVSQSYGAAERFMETNSLGTEHVMQACQRHGIERVVIASSSEVYGPIECLPVNELHPLGGTSPYALSKIAAERVALSCCESFGVPAVVLRLFNTFGPRQSTRAVIPRLITQVLSGASPITLGRLDSFRDFSAVQDTCGAFIAALSSVEAVGTVLNLGTGFECSIADLVRMVEVALNRRIQVREDAELVRSRPGEVLRVRADNKKARTLLEWTPACASEDGMMRALAECCAWYRDQQEGEICDRAANGRWS